MSIRPEQLLRQYHAWERKTDRLDFQWRARLLQSIWREAQGLEAGESGGKVRGARLRMPEAKQTLTNYLTETIRDVVRQEVQDPVRAKGKLFGAPRIYNNLLSSQPLCFNLFGELTRDLTCASNVFRAMSGGRVANVTSIDFEYSPGRGDLRYTGDRSAFDVYVQYQTPQGGSGFVGIEVKYHEALDDAAADHRERYDDVAREMDCFEPSSLPLLRQRPLQQIWRDHLLAGAHRSVDGFQDGFFVMLYPSWNTACSDAAERYQDCLRNQDTFVPWTLDDMVASLRTHGAGSWVDAFEGRYLEMSRLPESARP